jgi:hypothetical protein
MPDNSVKLHAALVRPSAYLMDLPPDLPPIGNPYVKISISNCYIMMSCMTGRHGSSKLQ